MFTTLSRKLLHPLIALSLALTLVVSPMSTGSAQAHGRHNNGDFVAAMIALGLFGLIVTNEAGKRNGGGHASVPANKRLPAACLKTYDTPNGNRTAFSLKCLRRNFSYYSHLPTACRDTLRVYDDYGYLRTERVFRPRCLQDRGYRVIHNR